MKSRDVTASEIQQRVMQGAARFQMSAVEREANWKKPLLQNAFELIRQNMTQPQIIRIIGEDNTFKDKPVTLADLQLGVDIKVGGGLYEQARHEKKQALQGFLMMGAQPAFAQYLNIPPLLEEIFASEGFKNPKRFIKSPMTAQTEEMGRGLQGAMLGGLEQQMGQVPELAGAAPGGSGGPEAELAGLLGPGGPSGPSGEEPPPPPAASGPMV